MYTTFVDITPDVAAEMLTHNTRNRTMRASTVNQYADDIVNDRFKTTHQGIAFNGDGTLLDGQHRLAAIVQSGKTVKMMVTYGVDCNSQLVMDTHAKRNLADALSLHNEERISDTDVAIARMLLECGTGKFSKASRSAMRVSETVEELRNVLPFIHDCFGTSKTGAGSAGIRAGVVAAWFYVNDLEMLKRFCSIVTGNTVPEGEAERAPFVLRNFALTNPMQMRVNRSKSFFKTQFAISAFFGARPVHKLRDDLTVYPYPLVNPVRT